MVDAQECPTDSKDVLPVETDPEKVGHGEMEDFVYDRAVERRLLRKVDIYVLPMLAIMYLFK